MSLIRSKRVNALINRLNNIIEIQPYSLRILKTISKHAQTSYLFGGCVRNACYAALYKKEAGTESLSGDTDLLTTATTMQIKAEFPDLKHHARIDLLCLHDSNYKDSIDIRRAPSHHDIFDINKLSDYFDCSINSILYSLEDGLLDPSGHGLADLKNGIIDVYNPNTAGSAIRLIRGLRFSIRFDFKISEETIFGLITQLPRQLFTIEDSAHANKELLKLLTEGNIEKTLIHLLENVPKHTEIKIIDLLLPTYISAAIKKYFISASLFNCMVNMIKQSRDSKSIAPIYDLLIWWAVCQDNKATFKISKYSEIVNENRLFQEAMSHAGSKISLLAELSLFNHAYKNHLNGIAAVDQGRFHHHRPITYLRENTQLHR